MEHKIPIANDTVKYDILQLSLEEFREKYDFPDIIPIQLYNELMSGIEDGRYPAYRNRRKKTINEIFNILCFKCIYIPETENSSQNFSLWGIPLLIILIATICTVLILKRGTSLKKLKFKRLKLKKNHRKKKQR